MKNPYPRTKLASYAASVVFALSQLTCAQCPELCDSNENTAVGQSALVNNTTGMNNTAVGFQALQNSNADGNTATGYQALLSNTSGTFNTAYGQQALSSNTVTSENTAFGAFALSLGAFGAENTAVGYEALSRNTSGGNTAVGWEALGRNTTGSSDVAVGSGALAANIVGSGNTAVGAGALTSNIGAGSNTAVGENALVATTSGNFNTALGANALTVNTTGHSNIAVGTQAGRLLAAGSNNIYIGNQGVASESSTIRLGDRLAQKNTYIAGISGRTIAGGVGVLIDSQGHLGTNTSSARYKEQIKPMDKSSEAILSLQPVTFRYKKELDPVGQPQFGLVAEEVSKVNPDLVARDEQGKPYTVRYEAVNAMLLNEFLKEHRTVQELKSTVAKQDAAIAQQESTNAEQLKKIETLMASLKAQAAQIQKVSDQLEASKPPRLVADGQ